MPIPGATSPSISPNLTCEAGAAPEAIGLSLFKEFHSQPNESRLSGPELTLSFVRYHWPMTKLLLVLTRQSGPLLWGQAKRSHLSAALQVNIIRSL